MTSGDMAGNPATTSLHLVLQGLVAVPQILPLSLQRAAENRAVLVDWLNHSSCFSADLPPHGIIAALNWREGGDDRALVQHLAQSVGVLLAPGAYFGMPGKLRIAYGLPSERLKAALALLEKGAQAYSGL